MKELDIDEYCDELFRYYHKNLKIIPIPSNKTNLFDKILEMAINKYPPFKKGKSDPGFKDAIIYKSLQDFNENNKEYDKYVLVTGDSEFLNPDNNLKKNFSKDGSSKLEIVNNKEIISYLVDKFELYGDLNKYIVEYLYDYACKKFFKCFTGEVNSVDYWIKNWNLQEKSTKIKKLNENEFEVAIFISIDIGCRDDENWQPVLRNPVEKTVIHQENYNLSLEGGEWKMSLIYSKYLFF